ncbi:hypothetical protein XENOCAPTIV_018338 [Xenoophorus captivus]|uniref:Uncharacterized protein n=1 Tax=Xenoophorus captivus TaxID=1517983 RepID=A0ABV0RJK9_9TELE
MQSSLNHIVVNMDTLEDDDALFLANVLLDECKPEGVSETGPEKCVWHEEDEEGNPVPKRSRTEEGRKHPSSTDTPTDTCGSMDPSCAPSTREQCVTGTVQDIGSLVREVQDLLGPAENLTLSHWKDRKASTLEKWTVLRPFYGQSDFVI